MAGPVRAEASSDTGRRILQAALETFSEKGFDGAKTREIAARADVTLGLLQYYYGSKLELWKAAVDLAFAELASGFQALLADASLADERELLRVLIENHVRFVGRNPAFVRIMHDEGKRRGPRMRWLVDRHVKPLFDGMLPVIERAQEKGVLPAGIPPVHFVYLLVGAVGIFFHQSEECKRVSGVDPTDPEAIEAHLTAVQALFLGPQTKENSR